MSSIRLFLSKGHHDLLAEQRRQHRERSRLPSACAGCDLDLILPSCGSALGDVDFAMISGAMIASRSFSGGCMIS